MIEDLDNEIWMVHPQFDWMAASNFGRIKSLERDAYKKDGTFHQHRQEKLRKLQTDKDGYLWFSIKKNGKVLAHPKVHRFVFECMNQCIIPDDERKLQINHLNEVKTDNRIENLSLCTASENINYGTRNERSAEALSKRVGQYTLEGNLIKIWKSTMEAERNGYHSSAVSYCCNGKRKTHKGFIWKYIE